MANPVVTLTFNLDTYELDIDAPDLTIEFVYSLIRRADKMIEDQMAVVRAQHISQGLRASQVNDIRTQKVLSKLKLQ